MCLFVLKISHTLVIIPAFVSLLFTQFCCLDKATFCCFTQLHRYCVELCCMSSWHCQPLRFVSSWTELVQGYTARLSVDHYHGSQVVGASRENGLCNSWSYQWKCGNHPNGLAKPTKTELSCRFHLTLARLRESGLPQLQSHFTCIILMSVSVDHVFFKYL